MTYGVEGQTRQTDRQTNRQAHHNTLFPYRETFQAALIRLPAVEGVTYLAACHYSFITLFYVVFCVLLYAANKLSLSLTLSIAAE